MANLTRAHQELFRRRPDERFESLAALLNAVGVQRVFRRAGRGPERRGQRSSEKSRLKVDPGADRVSPQGIKIV